MYSIRTLYPLFFSFIAVLGPVSSLMAQPSDASSATPGFEQGSEGEYRYLFHPDDPLKARYYQLKNGLTVILSPNPEEPRIQTLIAVRAGSKHDPADNTGLAHYLEHMLFKGTDRYGSLDWGKEARLTDPRLFSGIGNAYSDEILHRARMSPVKLTSRLTDEEIARVHEATQTVLREWVERMRAEAQSGFPEKVTAFRAEMAVHGKYQQPCPVCGTAVQRIRYADNETNYFPRCQTEGRLLADRALSRLLQQDWPRRIEELEG